MLAKPLGSSVPEPDSVAGGLAFEPKWDGFRTIIFRNGDDVLIQSRSAEQPYPRWDLTYAFPEVVAFVRDLLPRRCAVDGELIIIEDDRLQFERLGTRLRPRSEAGKWKITELSTEHPASFVGFDLLAIDGDTLLDSPYDERRERLEGALSGVSAPVHLTPMTTDHQLAQQWFTTFEGAGLDGLIAKPRTGTYQPGKRSMFKVKPSRSADVVIAGWRPFKNPGPDGSPIVGSLVLGLHDEDGTLHHVGVASSFTAKRRAELVAELAPYESGITDHPWAADPNGTDPNESGARRPGAPSRWSAGKNLEWVPLRPELVAEVGYDHMEGTRFRHIASFMRWRPDRDPASCTFGQLETIEPLGISTVLR